MTYQLVTRVFEGYDYLATLANVFGNQLVTGVRGLVGKLETFKFMGNMIDDGGSCVGSSVDYPFVMNRSSDTSLLIFSHHLFDIPFNLSGGVG